MYFKDDVVTGPQFGVGDASLEAAAKMGPDTLTPRVRPEQQAVSYTRVAFGARSTLGCTYGSLPKVAHGGF